MKEEVKRRKYVVLAVGSDEFFGPALRRKRWPGGKKAS